MNSSQLPTRFMNSNERYYPVRTEAGDTVELPSVTTILQVIAKPGLVPWARNVALASVREALESSGLPPVDPVAQATWVDNLLERAKAAPDQIRDDAADFGKAVHAYIHETGFRGEQIETSPKVKETGERFMVWLRSSGLTLLESEKMVYCLDHGYAGTLDLVAEDTERRRIIIDIKTGNALYPEMASQVAAYAHAYEATVLGGCHGEFQLSDKIGQLGSLQGLDSAGARRGPTAVTDVWLVRMPKDREQPIELWKESDWRPWCEDFFAAKRLWERLHRHAPFVPQIRRAGTNAAVP